MGNNSVSQYRQFDPEVCDAWHNSKFTLEEISEWFNGFKASHPTGYVTMEEFKNIYRDLFEDGNPDEFAERVFRMYDTDGSGTLNFREFIAGMSPITSWKDPKTRIDWIFRLYDKDTDGHITKVEMMDVLRSILKMSPDRKDSLKSKLFLEEKEIDAEVIAERVFQKFDLDCDGKLTKQELIECAEEDALLSHLLA